MCLLLATFLKFMFNQKEKRGFIWAKPFDYSNFYQKKRAVPVALPEFQKYEKNFQFWESL